MTEPNQAPTGAPAVDLFPAAKRAQDIRFAIALDSQLATMLDAADQLWPSRDREAAASWPGHRLVSPYRQATASRQPGQAAAFREPSLHTFRDMPLVDPPLPGQAWFTGIELAWVGIVAAVLGWSAHALLGGL